MNLRDGKDLYARSNPYPGAETVLEIFHAVKFRLIFKADLNKDGQRNAADIVVLLKKKK